MVTYLFSGIDRKRGFTAVQAKHLKSDIKDNSRIVYISSIFNNYKRNDKQLEEYNNNFKDIGINFKKSRVLDERVSKQEAKEIIIKSNVVFLLGGSPKMQIDFINSYELVDAVKQAKLIIGVSAGSMNLSKRVIYKDDFDNYTLQDYKGIGITDINIFPHFDMINETCKEEIEEIKKIMPLILLPNNSFIIIKNGKTNIIGKHY